MIVTHAFDSFHIQFIRIGPNAEWWKAPMAHTNLPWDGKNISRNMLQCPAMPCNVWCVNYGWLWIVMLRRGPLFRQQSPIWSLNTILEVWAIKKLKILEVFSRDAYTMIHTSWFCISLSAGSVVLMVFPLSAHAHLVARTYFRLIQGCRHTCHHLPHRTWRKYLT